MSFVDCVKGKIDQQHRKPNSNDKIVGNEKDDQTIRNKFIQSD